MKDEAREARFWGRFAPLDEHGCREWTGTHLPTGYGMCSYAGRWEGVHRIAYRLSKGPIPPRMFVLHTCDNPPCGEPNHLFIGTPAENTQDMMRKGRHRSGAASGELNSNATLRREQAESIFRRWHAGERQVDLANEYGVRQAAISKIIRGISWPDIDRAVSSRRVPWLTENDVSAIKARIQAGELDDILAAEYRKSPETIKGIRLGYTHPNVQPQLLNSSLR